MWRGVLITYIREEIKHTEVEREKGKARLLKIKLHKSITEDAIIFNLYLALWELKVEEDGTVTLAYLADREQNTLLITNLHARSNMWYSQIQEDSRERRIGDILEGSGHVKWKIISKASRSFPITIVARHPSGIAM